MEKKYILTDETIEYFGHTLHRIKAVKDFATISASTLGGYIESEGNLDHIGAAKVSGNAKVFGNAVVSGNTWVSGDVMVSGNAAVHEPSDIALVKGFGSEFRTTSFFHCADGRVRCRCGCFYGTIDDFRVIVSKTHGDSKYAKEYLMIADLMELHFKED